MANTLSVMTNVLRNAVSKQRIRYKENGFNLDLAYICDNIIAMGYPADNLESIYRNRLEDVYKFLEENHSNHYKIYNLCLERSYDKNKFHGRVSVYPFEDHNPPTIELIQKFCHDVDTWLNAHPANVAAVHCKAGKGRTGTMICCYLLYSRQHNTAEDALAYYDEKRTKDRKGVTIPSQRRYVQYFSKLLQSEKAYEKRTLQFCEIRFTEANALHNQGTVHCSISVLQDTTTAVRVETLYSMCIDFRKSYTVDLTNVGLEVTGDIKVELNSKPARKKIFHFWVNTYFIKNDAAIEGEGEDARFVYTLGKNEIDDAHKDKEHKCYTEDFKVQLVFFVNKRQTLANSGSAIVNRVGNSNNHCNDSSAINMGATRILNANMNSQGNQTICGDLNYHCDQRSSSSSASTSSLAGGASGFVVIGKDLFKRNSNGNAANAHMDGKMQNASAQLTNHWYPGCDDIGSGAGGKTQIIENNVEAPNVDCKNAGATVKNVAPTSKLKEQQQQQQQQQHQQQQQQYQPSESNVPIVQPSKEKRNSKLNTPKDGTATSASNEPNTINAYGGKTPSTAFSPVANKIGTRMPANNVSASKNGTYHWKNIRKENDTSCELEHFEQDDDDDDDDVGEDWESGESPPAKPLSHKAKGISKLSTEITNTTTKQTKVILNIKNNAEPQSSLSCNYPTSTKTTFISTQFPSDSITSALTTRPITNTNDQTQQKQQQQQRRQHLLHDNDNDNTSSFTFNLNKLALGNDDDLRINLANTELTNTSVSCSRSSHRSYPSNAYLSGDHNNGNESSVSNSASASGTVSTSSSYASFKKVVKNDLDEKYYDHNYGDGDDDDDDDDDDNDDDDGNGGIGVHESVDILDKHQQHQRQKAIENIVEAGAMPAIATPLLSRNKFFNFSLSKASPSVVCSENTISTNYAAARVPPPKQPFFRRKSFKSAASADGKESGNCAALAASDELALCPSLSSGGLTKQKLKIKLKKNRFKLGQKLQKLQNYLRSDPDEFCENFAQQTIAMRRNSNCSVASRQNKTAAMSTSTSNATAPSKKHLPCMPISMSVSVPKSAMEASSPQPPLASVELTSLEHLSTDIDVSLHNIHAIHSSSSATASNASLGSSIGCDASCGGRGCSSRNTGTSEDYYSSICDNQLSFNNSPCKSPRSLIDIALMSAGDFRGARSLSSASNQHHHHPPINHGHHHQHQHHQFIQQQHTHQKSPTTLGNQNQKTNFNRTSSAQVPKNQQQPQQQQQRPHETPKGKVIIVAAKPAKTDAIGFNVKTEASATTTDNHEQSPIKIDSASNGFPLSTPLKSCSSSDTTSTETPTERSSLYFTPPSSSVSNEDKEVFDSSASYDASAAAKNSSPFEFPNISAELVKDNLATMSMSTNHSQCQRENYTLKLKLGKISSSPVTKAIDEFTVDNKNQFNKSKTPSTDETSLESIDHGYSPVSTAGTTTTTGTSSSGFSNSYCYCSCPSAGSNAGGSSATCTCDPFASDLERYATSTNTAENTETDKNSTQHSKLSVDKIETTKCLTSSINGSIANVQQTPITPANNSSSSSSSKRVTNNNNNLMAAVPNDSSTFTAAKNNSTKQAAVLVVGPVACDAVNNVLHSNSTKPHPYKKRAHNGSARLEDGNNATNNLPRGATVTSSSKPTVQQHAQAQHQAVIAKNLKPRPRRETT